MTFISLRHGCLVRSSRRWGSRAGRLLGALALCIILVGCGSSSSVATTTAQLELSSPVTPGPVATVALKSATICPAGPSPESGSSTASVIGGVYFVHSAAKARKLSSVPVAAPARLPAGLVIQGFEIPPGGGSSSSTKPAALPIVTIDFAHGCDPRSPALVQLEESTSKPQSRLAQGGPDAATVKKLTLGGKQVTWSSTDRQDGFEWQGKNVVFNLIVVTKDAVPLPEIEAMIAAMPGS